MTDTKIQNLVSGAIAVMFGFATYKIIQTQLLKKSLSESMSGATGSPNDRIYPNPCLTGKETQCADLCARSGGVMQNGYCVQPSRVMQTSVSAKKPMRSFF